jgi:hypothetical protein
MAKRDNDSETLFDAKPAPKKAEKGPETPAVAPDSPVERPADEGRVTLPKGVSRVSTPVGTFRDGDEATPEQLEYVAAAVAHATPDKDAG